MYVIKLFINALVDDNGSYLRKDISVVTVPNPFTNPYFYCF